MKLTQRIFNRTYVISAALVAALVTLPVASAYADDSGPGLKGRMAIMKMMRSLDLSDDQKAEMRVIMEEQRDQMQELRAEIDDDYGDEIHSLRSETRSKLETVLTVEQLEKFDEFNEKREQRREKRRGESEA